MSGSEEIKEVIPENLDTTFAGVKIRSPLGISPINMPLGERSAVTPEIHADVLAKHVRAGAGFVYAPGANYITQETIDALRKQARPRATSTAHGGMRFLKGDVSEAGLEALYHINTPMTSAPEGRMRSFDMVRRMIEALKKKLPEKVALIASVSPLGDFPESAVASAKKVEEVGVDLIEVNVSCPAPPGIEGAVDYYLEKRFPLIMVGALVGDYPDLVVKIARDVVKAVSVPVGVKISHLIGFPRVVGLARELRDNGVKFIEILNQTPAIVPPDIYNRGKTRWPYADGNPFVAASGGFLRIGCYANVAGVSKFAPGIDIAASGGIMKPEHAVEVMMLGARLVECATGMLFKGRRSLTEATQFLEKFLKDQGYRNLEELIGIGVPHIMALDQVNVSEGKVYAEVDPVKCQGSGICTDQICVVIDRSNNGKAKVRTDACSGCGMCVEACPNQAISLKLR